MSTDTVILSVVSGVGRITLNKPQALNALDLSMIQRIAAALHAWRNDPHVSLVVIDHAGDRGFVAGGDALGLAISAIEDGVEARRYLSEQYSMNAEIANFSKPVVAFADGAVIGGGLGLTIPAKYTIATDRTMMAFMETTIGMAPDVGASWALSRLAGSVGMWLALTGEKVRGMNCVVLGLADAFIEHSALPEVKAKVLASPGSVYEILGPLQIVPVWGEARRNEIERLFGASTLRGVLVNLAADRSAVAEKCLAALRRASPVASVATFELLRRAAALKNFGQAIDLEYRVNGRLLMHHDFRTWSKAVLIDKGEPPGWRPSTIERVDVAAVESLFEPLEGGPVSVLG